MKTLRDDRGVENYTSVNSKKTNYVLFPKKNTFETPEGPIGRQFPQKPFLNQQHTLEDI